jgi:ElaB/YqjD/DUF883 family membrane-anchored ribosome-binding protein
MSAITSADERTAVCGVCALVVIADRRRAWTSIKSKSSETHCSSGYRRYGIAEASLLQRLTSTSVKYDHPSQTHSQGVIMMNLRDIQIPQNVESALEDVARSLQKAAKDAEGLSGDASEALSKAAAEVTRAAGSLREHAAAVARNVVQKAAHEVQEHPIASLASAITAAAALVGVIAKMRHKDSGN